MNDLAYEESCLEEQPVSAAQKAASEAIKAAADARGEMADNAKLRERLPALIAAEKKTPGFRWVLRDTGTEGYGEWSLCRARDKTGYAGRVVVRISGDEFQNVGSSKVSQVRELEERDVLFVARAATTWDIA